MDAATPSLSWCWTDLIPSSTLGLLLDARTVKLTIRATTQQLREWSLRMQKITEVE